MVQLPDILDFLTIPDSDAFRQLSSHFQDWGNQHQDHMRQLDNGHSNLKESWQGDGADAYSQLHTQMRQHSNAHQDQRQQASSTLDGTAALLEAAQILQDLAIVYLAAAGISFVMGFFTAGTSNVLTAAETEQAVEKQGEAEVSAQGARLLLLNGFNNLTGIIESWRILPPLLLLPAVTTTITIPSRSAAATVDTIYAAWHTKIKDLTKADINALLCQGFNEDQINQLLEQWNRFAGMGIPDRSLHNLIGDLEDPDPKIATGARNLLYSLVYLWTEPNFVEQIQSQAATPLGPWNIVGFNIPRVGQGGDVDLVIRTRLNGQVTTLVIEVGSSSKGSEPPGRFNHQMDALIQQATLYQNGTPCVCLVAPNPGGPTNQPREFRKAITRATGAVGANHVFVIYPPSASCPTS